MAERVDRVRLLYLYPSELTDRLVDAVCATGVPYFDLSLQHASAPLLRAMKRWGSGERFVSMIDRIRADEPDAVFRSSFIVGFPGETEDDLATLCAFLEEARLDVTGVFGYSDEDGTEAAAFPEGQKLDADEVWARAQHVTALVEELTSQRAEERLGEQVTVLVEDTSDGAEGRADHQGPEVDGTTTLLDTPPGIAVGDVVNATVVATDGVDLVAHVGGQP